MSFYQLLFTMKNGFTSFTDTYNSGSATITAPAGATSVVIKLWGGGGRGGAGRWTGSEGFFGGGAGAGAYVIKTVAVTGGTTQFTYSVGVGGTSGVPDASSSTITTPSLTAGGGFRGDAASLGGDGLGGAGGTATGGDTGSANGGDGLDGSDGGNSPNGGVGGTAGNPGGVGGTPGGGGGGGGYIVGSGQAGGSGGNGRITFTWS